MSVPDTSSTEPEQAAAEQTAAEPAPAPIRIRYRVRFAKTDLLKWTSHRDLARLWERLVRRAALKLSMTEGFHPKPRIAFPSALALGVESFDEVVELELAEELSAQELFERLAQDDQPGLTIKSVHQLPERFGKAQLAKSDYRISIPESDHQLVQTAVETLLAKEAVEVERKGKTITANVAEQIPRLEMDGDNLLLTLANTEGASLRPGDVLDVLGFSDWIEQGAAITRTKVILQREFETDDSSCFAIAAEATANSENEGAR